MLRIKRAIKETNEKGAMNRCDEPMKKLFSLILALCMACMLIPAMAEDSITGE